MAKREDIAGSALQPFRSEQPSPPTVPPALLKKITKKGLHKIERETEEGGIQSRG